MAEEIKTSARIQRIGPLFDRLVEGMRIAKPNNVDLKIEIGKGGAVHAQVVEATGVNLGDAGGDRLSFVPEGDSGKILKRLGDAGFTVDDQNGKISHTHMSNFLNILETAVNLSHGVRGRGTGEV